MLQVTELSTRKRALLEKCFTSKLNEVAAKPASIARRPSMSSAPVSFAQEQILLHTQMASDIPFYNEAITIRRFGPLDVAVLKRCMLEIIRRHEICRTTFETLGSNIAQ